MRHQFRNLPTVGWTDKELVWLRAALTLPASDFLQACEDIAGMSGRTVGAIASKARSLAAKPPIKAKYPRGKKYRSTDAPKGVDQLSQPQPVNTPIS